MDVNELAARNGLAERMKAERMRLGLTHDELAEKAGISRSTVFNYENGSRVPDALLLQRLAQLGMDVGYLVLGQRTQASELSCDAQQLLDRYELVPPRLKTVIDGVAQLAAAAFGAGAAHTTEVTYNVPAPTAAPSTLHEPSRKPRRAT